MKKLCVFTLIFLITGIFANAQEAKQTKAANAKDNWISGELVIPVRYLGIGIAAQYERMLSAKISLGANIYYSFFGDSNDLGLEAFFRYYPWGKTFFLGMGLGLNYYMLVKVSFGFLEAGLSPEIGWKIDTGKPGGFFIQPGIKLPGIVKISAGFDFGIYPSLYFGMGYAF